MTSPGATNIEQRLARYRRMFDLSGKKALVLGAASGIGKASAEAFFALGATVIWVVIPGPSEARRPGSMTTGVARFPSSVFMGSGFAPGPPSR